MNKAKKTKHQKYLSYRARGLKALKDGRYKSALWNLNFAVFDSRGDKRADRIELYVKRGDALRMMGQAREASLNYTHALNADPALDIPRDVQESVGLEYTPPVVLAENASYEPHFASGCPLEARAWNAHYRKWCRFCERSM
jgi:hypothetical protein